MTDSGHLGRSLTETSLSCNLSGKQAESSRCRAAVSQTHLFTDPRVEFISADRNKTQYYWLLFSSETASITHRRVKKEGGVVWFWRARTCPQPGQSQRRNCPPWPMGEAEGGTVVVLFSEVGGKKVSWNLNDDTWPTKFEWTVRWPEKCCARSYKLPGEIPHTTENCTEKRQKVNSGCGCWKIQAFRWQTTYFK